MAIVEQDIMKALNILYVYNACINSVLDVVINVRTYFVTHVTHICTVKAVTKYTPSSGQLVNVKRVSGGLPNGNEL